MSLYNHLTNRRSTGRVTLADVAREVGVGAMTVSRALRTPEMVSEVIREKIQIAVKKLGYVPNLAARDLASASSRNIVVVTSSLLSIENNLILETLQKQLRFSSFQLVILVANENSWLSELINNAPLAVILLNLPCPKTEAEWIQNSGILCLEIGPKQTNAVGVNIGIDIKSAVQKVVDYLVNKGYHDIGLLCAKQEQSISQQYLACWHRVLHNHRLNSHQILYSSEPMTFSTGAKLFNDSISNWGKIDALVFLSDQLACGALFEAQRQHISIPYEIAIIGLGGLESSEAAYPTLTTLYIPYAELGQIAGKKLIELLSFPDIDIQKNILLDTHLIERESA
ncbi:MAG: LacI family DNA-binding transcriptional regulator [[Actinobacillus] rossii]|uniref:Transcriptional regulator n=1 Tax=[Actinobacillus] rossii TaxID=123820 RepID=A0A380TP86_9PAST|nr:LacI family transcriptional regulator [[Actinobacillus] rossii]MDY4506030.1 LacI family DNA-binding transcriptional regulator [[Actinobacillus] rossii]SUT88357.1 transcriptional regulator [[Actinobacillus] rossii]